MLEGAISDSPADGMTGNGSAVSAENLSTSTNSSNPPDSSSSPITNTKKTKKKHQSLTLSSSNTRPSSVNSVETSRPAMSPSLSSSSPTSLQQSRASVPNTPHSQAESGPFNAPYVYGASFTHASRTRRPNISEDDGMFILSHVIREFDKLPLNVSVKKLPMTFWHYPLETWNRRLVQKQLPPAVSEETVRTFYYNNLKTYRGICSMLRLSGWSFDTKVMELVPPPEVEREDLYTPEGKKYRALMKRFPYMNYFRVLEILIDNREQGIVKDLDSIMSEVGLDDQGELNYADENSIGANSQDFDGSAQKGHEQSGQDGALQHQSGTPSFQGDDHHTASLQASLSTTRKTPQSAKSLQNHQNDLNLGSHSASSPSFSLGSNHSNFIQYNDEQPKRGRGAGNRDTYTHLANLTQNSIPSLSQNSLRMSQSYQDESAFAEGQPSSIPGNQSFHISSRGTPLPPPSQLIGNSFQSHSQSATPHSGASALLGTGSSSILQPRPTVFSSFVLHAKARIADSNDLSILLRALFASDSRYLLYQIVRDSTSVAIETARAEGRTTISPDNMDEILLLILEIAREIAKENDWEVSDQQKPLTDALSDVSLSNISFGYQQEKTQNSNDKKSASHKSTFPDISNGKRLHRSTSDNDEADDGPKRKKTNDQEADLISLSATAIKNSMEPSETDNDNYDNSSENPELAQSQLAESPASFCLRNNNSNDTSTSDRSSPSTAHTKNYSDVYVNDDGENDISKPSLRNQEKAD